MPGAADRVADDQPLGKRPAVVAADGADGEPLVADAGEQHGLLADMAGDAAADRHLLGGDAGGEIGSGRAFRSALSDPPVEGGSRRSRSPAELEVLVGQHATLDLQLSAPKQPGGDDPVDQHRRGLPDPCQHARVAGGVLGIGVAPPGASSTERACRPGDPI